MTKDGELEGYFPLEEFHKRNQFPAVPVASLRPSFSFVRRVHAAVESDILRFSSPSAFYPGVVRRKIARETYY